LIQLYKQRYIGTRSAGGGVWHYETTVTTGPLDPARSRPCPLLASAYHQSYKSSYVCLTRVTIGQTGFKDLHRVKPNRTAVFKRAVRTLDGDRLCTSLKPAIRTFTRHTVSRSEQQHDKLRNVVNFICY
jgi:hypothetical protein